MARNISAPIPQTQSPHVFDLVLPAVGGESHSLSSLAGWKGTIVVFVAGGCPTVRAYESRLMALQSSSDATGVNVVAVNANNASLSPPDTMDEMSKRAGEHGFTFPYLKDIEAAVARNLGAVCTPHAFLFDAQQQLVYSGRIDDSRLGDRITSRDLEDAVADLIAGRKIRVPQTEPFGCSIVW
jgi:thiol-disulfide isomerase/thioredoxin